MERETLGMLKRVACAIGGPAGLLAAVWTLLPMPAVARIPLAVPEPTTLSLFGAGAVAMIVLRRMRGGK